MVVVHPCKGIFVISVKNTTTIKPKDVLSDMNKHVQFIRWLFEFYQNKLAPNQHQCLTPNGKDTFNSPSCKSINTTNTTNASKSLQSNLPIHGLLITHRIDIGEKGLEKLGYFTSQENEFRLVFQPEDMKNFQSKWQSILSGITLIDDEVIQANIELLTARLIALNSMEGSLALIHNQISSNRVYV